MKKIHTQVCVIGAGAGGIGCVYRLIKNKISTIVIDKNSDYGGTMTFGGIDGWEPGVSLDGIHLLIKEELEKIPKGAHAVERVPSRAVIDPDGIYDTVIDCFSKRPWGYNAPMGKNYEDTLSRKKGIRYQFEGDCLIQAVRNIFTPYAEFLTELFGFRYFSCEKNDDRIVSVTVTDGKDEIVIYADVFVDASGDIVLARDAGCAWTFGTESADAYSEPSAGEESNTVNGVTYAFRVAKTEDPNHIDAVPPEQEAVNLGQWKEREMRSRVSLCVRYPNGDLHFNMLPTMQGAEYFALGEQADSIGQARVYAYWNYLQIEKGLCGYTLKRIYDAGIRESYRLKGKYILKEQDIRSGFLRQPKIGRTVAIADHAMDIHGKNGMCNEVESPYEIPLECAMTNEFCNLFVSCRGASFTHIAASSVRLSRTMLSMGEGIGEYISELILAKMCLKN